MTFIFTAFASLHTASHEKEREPAKLVEGFCGIFCIMFQLHRRIPQSACGCQLPFQGSLATNEPPLKRVTPHGVGRCPQGRGDRSVRGEPPLGGGGISRHISQPVSQGVTLLFFFAKKKKRSKKRKEFAFHLYCKIQVSHEDYTRDFHQQKFPGGANRRLLPP